MVRVDAAAGVVTDDDRTWSLDLDCRSGAATVVIDDVAYRVAPMRWREKQRLARWAHLGPDFVARQLVRLAVVDDDSRPTDDDAVDVVAAVAAWVNGEAMPLPLESGLLTRVTLDVCRGSGLAPADLDDRDALEVEAMWSALDPPAATVSQLPATEAGVPFTPSIRQRGGDPWTDATRIVFVPDEVPAEAQTDIEDAGDTGDTGDTDNEPPSGAPIAPHALSIASGPQPDQPPPDPTPVEPPPEPPPEPPSASAPGSRRHAPRFRVLPSTDLPSSMTLAPPVRIPTADPLGGSAPSAHTDLCALTGQNGERNGDRPATDALRPVGGPRANAAPAVAKDLARASSGPSGPRVDAHVDADVDVHELTEAVLDVIADEVEYAAEALGIEV